MQGENNTARRPRHDPSFAGATAAKAFVWILRHQHISRATTNESYFGNVIAAAPGLRAAVVVLIARNGATKSGSVSTSTGARAAQRAPARAGYQNVQRTELAKELASRYPLTPADLNVPFELHAVPLTRQVRESGPAGQSGNPDIPRITLALSPPNRPNIR